MRTEKEVLKLFWDAYFIWMHINLDAGGSSCSDMDPLSSDVNWSSHGNQYVRYCHSCHHFNSGQNEYEVSSSWIMFGSSDLVWQSIQEPLAQGAKLFRAVAVGNH